MLGLFGCTTSALPAPTVVTNGQLDVDRLAASGNDIYWIDAGDASPEKIKHSHEGTISTVTNDLSNGALLIATDGPDVVWADSTGAVSDPAGVLIPPSGQTNAINGLVMTTDASYVSLGGTPGSIAKIASDGMVTTAIDNLSSPNAIAVDAVNLYIVDRLDESIYVRPLDADPATRPTRLALLTSSSNRTSIVSNGTHVYWSDVELVVHAMRLADGTTFDIASDGPVFALAVDDQDVYWISNKTIERAPVDGGTPETLAELPSNGFNAQSIAVTTDAVIWADNPTACDQTLEDCYPTTIESVPKS